MKAAICNRPILKQGGKYILEIPDPLVNGEVLEINKPYRFEISDPK